jgi:hypothetical protein
MKEKIIIEVVIGCASCPYRVNRDWVDMAEVAKTGEAWECLHVHKSMKARDNGDFPEWCPLNDRIEK